MGRFQAEAMAAIRTPSVMRRFLKDPAVGIDGPILYHPSEFEAGVVVFSRSKGHPPKPDAAT
jgi:hypothetical protein